VFNAQAPAATTKPLNFNPTGPCPAFEVPEEIASAAMEKQRNDEYQIAQLTSRNVPVAPIRTGLDGGTNPVFLAKLSKPSATFDADGRLRAAPPGPAVMPPGGAPPQGAEPESTGTLVADVPVPRPAPQAKQGNSSEPSFAKRLFGNLFASSDSKEPKTRVASADPHSSSFSSFFMLNGDGQGKGEGMLDRMSRAMGLRGSEPPTAAPAPPPKPKHAAHTQTAAAAAIRPKPQDANPPKPQQEANADSNAANGLLKGAQPVLPAGSFDSRWAGMR
jgi:hypothetical protein